MPCFQACIWCMDQPGIATTSLANQSNEQVTKLILLLKRADVEAYYYDTFEAPMTKFKSYLALISSRLISVLKPSVFVK